MKILPHDRLQALKRSRLYSKDYKKYLQERGAHREALVGTWPFYQVELSPAGERLCRKWGLQFPFDPDIEPTEADTRIFLPPPVTFLSDPNTWRRVEKQVLYEGLGALGEDGLTLHPDELAELGVRIKEERVRKADGKLTVMIDPYFDKRDILEAVEQLLEICHKPNQRRSKAHLVDKWRAYDMYQETPVLQQVSRQIFGYTSSEPFSPSYDERHSAQYRQVERAYRKAYQIINHLEKLASKHS